MELKGENMIKKILGLLIVFLLVITFTGSSFTGTNAGWCDSPSPNLPPPEICP